MLPAKEESDMKLDLQSSRGPLDECFFHNASELQKGRGFFSTNNLDLGII